MYILCGVFIRLVNYLFGDYSDKNLIGLSEVGVGLRPIFVTEDFE